MTNKDLLEQKIRASGKTRKFLAKKCGLSYQGFRNCVTNKSEFKAGQIEVLCEELSISNLEEKQAIFFARSGA